MLKLRWNTAFNDTLSRQNERIKRRGFTVQPSALLNLGGLFGNKPVNTPSCAGIRLLN